MSDTKRLFIVGCSRSGTTVLQSCFARHPSIKTFPETGFLLKAFGMRAVPNPISALGITLGKEWKSVNRLERALDLPQTQPARTLSLRESLSQVTSRLDQIAALEDRSIWLEKTPRHYYHAAKIHDYVPNAHVIHLIRRGTDVVASILDRAKKYPERFPTQLDCSYGIKQWNEAINIQAKLLGAEGHSFVLFDRFLASPEHELRRLCQEANIEFSEQMLNQSKDVSEHILGQEKWKSQTQGMITRPKQKFTELFNQQQQAQIIKQLDKRTYNFIRQGLGFGSHLVGPPRLSDRAMFAAQKS